MEVINEFNNLNISLPVPMPMPKPVLVKTLSELHWIVALQELKNGNLLSIQAGSSGIWSFKIVRSGGRFLRETLKEGKIIKTEFFY